MNKNDIKEAVTESLIEALKHVDEQKTPSGMLLKALGQIIPVAILGLLSWVSITIIDVQKDIAILQKDVVENRRQLIDLSDHLHEHDSTMVERSKENAVIHHVDREQRCNSCHRGGPSQSRIDLFGHTKKEKTK